MLAKPSLNGYLKLNDTSSRCRGSRDFAHLAVPICRKENVSGHKFKIGQSVSYAAPFSHSAAGDYKITLLLPPEDNERLPDLL